MGLGRRSRFGGVVFGVAVFMVFGLGFIALHGLPTISDASAEGANSLLSVGVETAMSIKLTPENNLAIDLTPTGAGAYSSKKLSVNVATNNSTGYKMTFSAGAGGTALTNASASSNNTLPPTSGTISAPTAINDNTWGFAVPGTQMNPTGLLPNDTSGFGTTYSEVTSVDTYAEAYATLPVYGSPITLKETTANSTSDNTDIYVGAKVNYDKPSGTYRGTVVFSAVGNWVPPEPPYPTPTTMQGMYAEYCDWMEYGDTMDLVDTRDNNIYTVAKIGDRCWMAENLALGSITEDMNLTSDDTNIESDWVLPMAIPNNSISTWNATQFPWVPANGNSNAYCAPTGEAYCGNLYHWSTAIAGASIDGITNGTIVASSICPAGWRLPTGAGSSREINQLFMDLGGESSWGAEAALLLTDAPFNAVYAGYYHNTFGGFQESGAVNALWSSTYYNGGAILRSTPSSVNTTGSGSVSQGRAIRCILEDN